MSSSYSVNWSAQQAHILEGLKNLFGQNDSLLTDVTLACDGEYVQAHKLVLSLCSSFFRDLFQKNRADKSNTIVILGNVSAQNLRYLLQFMYRGQVDIPCGDVDSFLQAGNILKVEGLAGKVSENDNGLQQPMIDSDHYILTVKSPSVSAPEASAELGGLEPSCSSVNVHQSSLNPITLDETGAIQDHPRETEVEIDESSVCNDVKSEPIPIFSGNEESDDSNVVEDSFEEMIEEQSDGLPLDETSSVTGTHSVPLSVPVLRPRKARSRSGGVRKCKPNMPGKKIRSKIYSYFKWLNSDKFRCNSCGDILSKSKTSTSNLWAHLSTTHPELNLKLLKIKRTKR